MSYQLFNGDCLEEMAKLAPGSVDLILTDPPYGTISCKWDVVIPFDKMWPTIWRLLKPNGACVLFGAEPFSSALRMSQIKHYKYDWTWVKTRGTGFVFSKIQPLRLTEQISVFYMEQPTYNPQGMRQHIKTSIRTERERNSIYGSLRSNKYMQIKTNYPENILTVKAVDGAVHPTQKPVELLKYLIKTYTNSGELVLDFTMGSGSTGVAALHTGRSFIGIERDPKYFEIAKKRVVQAEWKIKTAAAKS